MPDIDLEDITPSEPDPSDVQVVRRGEAPGPYSIALTTGGGGGGVSTEDFEALEAEVVAARGGRSSLGLRIENVGNFVTPNAMPYIPGRWMTNSFHADNLGVIAGAIDRIELAPFFVSSSHRFDSIGFRVSTASSTGGADGRCLIYEASDDGFTLSLVYAGPALSTSTTGARQDGSADLTINGSRAYWAGYHWNSAAQISGISIGSLVNLGHPSENSLVPNSKIRTTAAFGSHPETIDLASAPLINGVVPALIMRLAALA